MRWVVVWRSKSVRPQLGHATNSVFEMRAPAPWSTLYESLVERTTSDSVSILTKSPTPSHSKAPVRNDASRSFERKLLSRRTAVAVVFRIQIGADDSIVVSA